MDDKFRSLGIINSNLSIVIDMLDLVHFRVFAMFEEDYTENFLMAVIQILRILSFISGGIFKLKDRTE
jgi:hypothetical protein